MGSGNSYRGSIGGVTGTWIETVQHGGPGYYRYTTRSFVPDDDNGGLVHIPSPDEKQTQNT